MRLFKDLFTFLFKSKNRNEPWLDYYSREERSIKLRFFVNSLFIFLILFYN